MGANLFNSSMITHAGGMNKICDCASVHIKDRDMQGLLAQNIVFQYTRQPQQIFEIDSCDYYYVDAKATGTVTITNVIGPTAASLNAFLEMGLDVCKPEKITFDPVSCNCNNETPASLTIEGAILTSVNITVTSDTPSMQGTWTYMFANLAKT